MRTDVKTSNMKKLFVGVTLLLVILIPFIYGMRFYNSDDILIRNMLTGSMQFKQNPYVMFFPSWLSEIYIFLYRSIPNIEWYFVLYHILIICSFFIIFYCFYTNRLKQNLISFVFFMAYFVIYGKLIITEVHFTILSGILTLAGCLILFFKDTSKTYLTILAVTFIFLGVCYRLENGILILTCSLTFFWIYKCIMLKGIFLPVKKVIIKWSLILGVAFIVVVYSHQAVPNEIKEYAKTANDHRKIFDYKVLSDRVALEKTMDQVGWDSTEMNLFNWYIFPKSHAFSINNLRILASSSNGKIKKQNYKEIIFGMFNYFTSLEFQCPIILFFLTLCMVTSTRWKDLLIYLLLGIIVIISLLIILKVIFKFPALYIMISVFSSFIFIYYLMYLNGGRTIGKSRIIWVLIPFLGLIIVVKRNQSEALDYLKYYMIVHNQKPGLKNGKYVVCLSMLNHSYSYPNYYQAKYYEKLDLTNTIYLAPTTYHPASIFPGTGENEDILKWLVNNDQASLYLDHGYEDQISYVMKDIVNYLNKTYKYNVEYIEINHNKTASEVFLVNKQ